MFSEKEKMKQTAVFISQTSVLAGETRFSLPT